MDKENVFKNLENVVITSGKKFVAVKLLTSETIYFGVEKKCKVNELFSKICVHLGLADCAELFNLCVKQINCPSSLLSPLNTNTHYYSASQVEQSIKQEDTNFEEEFIFLNPNAKLSKYTCKQWKNSKSGLDPMGKAYLQCFFRVQFYVDSYLFITDRVARHHYYLQLRQNVINFNLSNLTLERAFLLTSLALQADKGNFNEKQLTSSSSAINNLSSSSNLDFSNNSFYCDKKLENYRNGQLTNKNFKTYFDPYDYMPKWIINQIGENYILSNMPSMHKEHKGISKIDAETMFIKEASEICSHNMHMYRLYKTNPSHLNKKSNSVNSHLNAFFHGHHFNSSINSNSSNSSTLTNMSLSVSNSNLSTSSQNNSSKESKVWLAICAIGVQIFEQDKQSVSKNDSLLSTNNLTDQLNSKLNNQVQNTYILRAKLSTFAWSDIDKLFFDKKKFEIRSNGKPIRKFTYFTHSDEMAKNLLWLCKFSHRFQLFIQPKLKEIKKRESDLFRKKYRESYIYSNGDKSSSEKNSIPQKINGWLEDFKKENIDKFYSSSSSDLKNNSLIDNFKNKDVLEDTKTNKNVFLDKVSLSEELIPIMDNLEKQLISSEKNAKKNNEEKVFDVALNQYSFSLINFDNKKNENLSLIPSSLANEQVEKNSIKIFSGFDNLDAYEIEHVQSNKNSQLASDITKKNNLVVQPNNYEEKNFIKTSSKNEESFLSLHLSFDEKSDNQRNETLVDRLYENVNSIRNNLNQKNQNFSLESLANSVFSEPSTNSEVSEQENNFFLNNKPFLPGTDTLDNTAVNKIKKRFSSPFLVKQNQTTNLYEDNSLKTENSFSSIINKSLIEINAKENLNNKSIKNSSTNFALSLNDLHETNLKNKKNRKNFHTINNNHLLEDLNVDGSKSSSIFIKKNQNEKAGFKNEKNCLLNAKSLPNVNSQFDSLENDYLNDIEKDGFKNEIERFNVFNKSDRSNSSENSVATIKSNGNLKQAENNNLSQKNINNSYCFENNFSDHQTENNLEKHLIKETNFFLKDKSYKNEIEANNYSYTNNSNDSVNKNIYENLNFEQPLIMASNIMTPNKMKNSLLPNASLISTTPNRIATKIGISSLNRCNNYFNNPQKNNFNYNQKNASLEQKKLRTYSYQLLNNENLSTINDPNFKSLTPFKTARASSDPGVLTYASSYDLLKNYNDTTRQNQHGNKNPTYSSSNQISNFVYNEINKKKNLNNFTKKLFHSSMTEIKNDKQQNEETKEMNNSLDQNIFNSKISNLNNHNYPLRLAESEINLKYPSEQLIPPPPDYASYENKKQQQNLINLTSSQLLMNGKLKATSEQQLNTIEPTLNHNLIKTLNKHEKYFLRHNDFLRNKKSDSIDDLQQLRQKSHDLDLPLITALFNDRSLMMLPKTVPNFPRQKHRKPKRYSWHMENNSLLDLSFYNNLTNSNLINSPNNFEKNYLQTDLDDFIDEDNDSYNKIVIPSKYDNNYNDLESDNLNKKSEFSLAKNSRADFIEKLWADNLLN